MRRRSVHAAFAAVALACAAFAGFEAMRLVSAQRANDALAAWSARAKLASLPGSAVQSGATTPNAELHADSDAASDTRSNPPSNTTAIAAVSDGPSKAPRIAADPPPDLASDSRSYDERAPRGVQLAQAVALSAAGRYAAAGQRFEALVDRGPLDDIGRAALFDLANMYLREGAGETASTVRSLPMIEQAKARYRALLRVAPDDWDARYNLERALRLVPETQEAMDASDSATKHDVRLRGAQSEDLP